MTIEPPSAELAAAFAAERSRPNPNQPVRARVLDRVAAAVTVPAASAAHLLGRIVGVVGAAIATAVIVSHFVPKNPPLEAAETSVPYQVVLPPPVEVGETPKAPPPPIAHDSIDEERRLLESVRRSLEHADPAGAKRGLAHYRARFHSGQLAEEADALGIEVLVRDGDVEAAKLAAGVFAKLHPGSVFQTKITRLLSPR